MSKKMSLVTQCGVAVLLMTSLVGAAPYSKYGRTCRDIGCLSSEVCVMTEDPCTTYSRDNCGRYPTCKKNTESGALTCATLICPTGQYCRTDNGRPTCVNTVPGLASAARRPTGTVRPSYIFPTPPPRTTSYGRTSGYSGNRNTIGGNSIYNRLFGGGNGGGGRYNPARTSSGSSGNGSGSYYTTHSRIDSRGNRVWTFSG